jgi:hypothetical protein
MRKFLFLFLWSFILCGCATTYKSLNWRGGYTDLTLDEDTFSICFVGNRFTSYQKVKNFCAHFKNILRYIFISIFLT